ncbi:MAG: hypothetical protein WC303_03240 [Candidatus Paceibacterota bacterium]
MEKDWQKLDIEPPAGLFIKVLNRIEAEERIMLLKRRIFIFSCAGFGSLIGLIFSFNFVRKAMVNSGFGDFFSLIFSDSMIVLNYWQNFFLTLLESFPIIEAIFFLGIVLLLLQLTKLISRDVKVINIIKANQYGF